MSTKRFWSRAGTSMLSVLLLLSFMAPAPVSAQVPMPTMLHPDLDVRLVADGLVTPTTMAFLDDNEFLVLEKTTGTVQHFVDGALQGTALDLAVNNASERGLLGIALDPEFESNHAVYLYWSCKAPPPTVDPFTPSQTECADTPELGADSEELLEVPLLGNRVDRFLWDGSTLTFDHNLIKLRSFQNDAGPVPPGQGDESQPPRGNHDGGVMAFGLDGKLYVFIGDVGRRGQLQNLPCGPTATCPGPIMPDDQFGGPEPDDAHLTGVVLRLNTDGTAPSDNPFYDAGASMGGEVGENIQKIFSYGHRNGFGIAVDPVSGAIWLQENGDDSFSELNRLEPGMNGGWIQIAGPLERLGQYKEIETTFGAMALQQLRWPPTNIANSPQEARKRLFMLPGARFVPPALSWKWEVAPGGMGFVESDGLGAEFQNDLFMGAATPLLEGGYLFHFDFDSNGRKLTVHDPRLRDRVADNLAKHEITESESLLIGRDFGVVTDIRTGPNGNLFVVSLSNGAIYEIFAKEGGQQFTTTLTGAAEVPGPGDPDGSGTATVTLNPDGEEVCWEIQVSDITLPATAAHIHEAPVGVAGPVVVTLSAPDANGVASGCTTVASAEIMEILEHPEEYYVNVHTSDYPAGAVRGQLSK
jgi:glucose/arabinose dehydrogenase